LSESSPAKPYQKSIYDCVIKAGDLAGNRSSPMAVANFQVLRQTNCPAVLMEYGFMDSAIDAKIIVNEEYSKAVGYSTMEGIAKVAGLKKKDKKEFVTIQLDVLKKGCSNAQVYAVQTMLNGFIGADIAFDGYFGSQTEQAVKNYQSKRGLPVTGVVDEATWIQLLKK
jgi:peptidoglycan hydrolase-like protein with peptidoglycan-binding domain